MKIKNKTRNLIIAERIDIADSFFSRFMGLMFRKNIADNYALLISQCAMIHTCFMKFTIDAVFLSKDMEVISIIENLKPWRFTKYFGNAYYTLELKSGNISKKIEIGDKLEIE